MIKNEQGDWMVEHHTHYQEIDGYDETILITQSEHMKLHHKLRKEGKCNIPPEDLRKISDIAKRRTFKLQNPDYHKNYNNINRKEINKRQREYNITHSEEIKIAQQRWIENNKEKHNKYMREYMREYRAKKKIKKEDKKNDILDR